MLKVQILCHIETIHGIYIFIVFKKVTAMYGLQEWFWMKYNCVTGKHCYFLKQVA